MKRNFVIPTYAGIHGKNESRIECLKRQNLVLPRKYYFEYYFRFFYNIIRSHLSALSRQQVRRSPYLREYRRRALHDHIRA